mmetsp:Transcript_135/g.345  ORF Transcript_135/g.345 Transcript_135/m.345 type:complete len:236 (+) Transcript_135:287-994(+)
MSGSPVSILKVLPCPATYVDARPSTATSGPFFIGGVAGARSPSCLTEIGASVSVTAIAGADLAVPTVFLVVDATFLVEGAAVFLPLVLPAFWFLAVRGLRAVRLLFVFFFLSSSAAFSAAALAAAASRLLACSSARAANRAGIFFFAAGCFWRATAAATFFGGDIANVMASPCLAPTTSEADSAVLVSLRRRDAVNAVFTSTGRTTEASGSTMGALSMAAADVVGTASSYCCSSA